MNFVELIFWIVVIVIFLLVSLAVSRRKYPISLSQLDATDGAILTHQSRKEFTALSNPAERSISGAELSECKGRKEGEPLLVGIYMHQLQNVVIFDVSKKPHFYGPGAGYHCLTGKDASRNLGTMDLQTTNPDLSDLSPAQIKVLLNWAGKFKGEYPMVGHLAVNDAKCCNLPVLGEEAPAPDDDLVPPFPTSTTSSATSSTSSLSSGGIPGLNLLAANTPSPTTTTPSPRESKENDNHQMDRSNVSLTEGHSDNVVASSQPGIRHRVTATTSNENGD